MEAKKYVVYWKSKNRRGTKTVENYSEYAVQRDFNSRYGEFSKIPKSAVIVKIVRKQQYYKERIWL